MVAKYFEVSYKSSSFTATFVADTLEIDGQVYVRGHGPLVELIDKGCTITPLIAMTPERVEALRYILNLALAHAEYELSEYVTDAQRAIVRDWLAQQPVQEPVND